MTGVEIDPVSAGLARVLCPDHTIVTADIEKCEIPEGSFDAAISNVPYSDAIKMDRMPLHDYMIKRAVAAVHPGGIVAVLTSYTMDKAREATHRALRSSATSSAWHDSQGDFESQAGDALCDLVVRGSSISHVRSITTARRPGFTRDQRGWLPRERATGLPIRPWPSASRARR